MPSIKMFYLVVSQNTFLFYVCACVAEISLLLNAETAPGSGGRGGGGSRCPIDTSHPAKEEGQTGLLCTLTSCLAGLLITAAPNCFPCFLPQSVLNLAAQVRTCHSLAENCLTTPHPTRSKTQSHYHGL